MASDTKQNTTFFKSIPTFPHKFSNWQATIKYYLGSDFNAYSKLKKAVNNVNYVKYFFYSYAYTTLVCYFHISDYFQICYFYKVCDLSLYFYLFQLVSCLILNCYAKL